MLTIEEGGWRYIRGSIVNSCLMRTVVPAYIQRLTGINPEWLFKIYPCFLYSLMPSFIHLIARKSFNRGYAVLASMFVLSHFYFAFYPVMGRVAIAWGFWAGLIWALVSERYWLALPFGLLVIFSHYGTAYITLGVIGVLLFCLIMKHPRLKLSRSSW